MAHWKDDLGVDTSLVARARKDPAVFREVVVKLLMEISEKLNAPPVSSLEEFGPPLLSNTGYKPVAATTNAEYPVTAPAPEVKSTRGRKAVVAEDIVAKEVAEAEG